MVLGRCLTTKRNDAGGGNVVAGQTRRLSSELAIAGLLWEWNVANPTATPTSRTFHREFCARSPSFDWVSALPPTRLGARPKTYVPELSTASATVDST